MKEKIKKGDKVLIDVSKSIYGNKLSGTYYFDSFEKKDNNEIAYINRFKGSGMNWAIKSDSIIDYETKR